MTSSEENMEANLENAPAPILCLLIFIKEEHIPWYCSYNRNLICLTATNRQLVEQKNVIHVLSYKNTEAYLYKC